MKYPTRLQFLVGLKAITPFVHVFLTIMLLYAVAKHTDTLTALKRNTECFYFVNIEEYMGGTLMTYSTTVSTKNEERAQEAYQKQVDEAKLSYACESCNHIPDSTKIIFYEDCATYDISEKLSTTLYATQ